MNRYWKFDQQNANTIYMVKNDGIDYKDQNGVKEITKEEYDKAVTFPNLAQENINHNYFNGAESAIRKSIISYKESLFIMTKVDGYGNVLTLTDQNLVLYNNLIQFEKAEEKATITRATAFYESKLNGDTDEEATTKAQAVVVDLSSVKAMNGKNEFISYLLAQHPSLIRKYISYVENLKYTTLLTEDEPQGGV